MTSPSKSVVKKRGRPLGSKNKTRRKALVKPFKQVKVVKRAYVTQLHHKTANLLVQISDLEHVRKNLHLVIDNLENKEIQYKAVIAYLENKLENK